MSGIKVATGELMPEKRTDGLYDIETRINNALVEYRRNGKEPNALLVSLVTYRKIENRFGQRVCIHDCRRYLGVPVFLDHNLKGLEFIIRQE